MKQPRFLGVTVFGYAAILAGILIVLNHVYLVSTHQRVSTWIIYGLSATIPLGAWAFFSPRVPGSKVISRTGFTWLLASFLLSGFTLLSQLVEIPVATAWAPTSLLVALGYTQANTAKIKKREHNWKGDTKKRVVQITDIHLGDVWDETTMKNIVNRVAGLEPDLVAVTGDLIDGMDDEAIHAVKHLESLNAPVVFVPGNHDGYGDQEELLKTLQGIGVHVLQDQTQEIGGIHVHGVDYQTPWKSTLQRIQEPDLILKHEPRVNIQDTQSPILCGHVHAGQIWPLHLLARLDFPYTKGTYTENNGFLHINNGTRTWGPPIRLGTRSEIFVLDLIP
jgi:hypothetical protein